MPFLTSVENKFFKDFISLRQKQAVHKGRGEGQKEWEKQTLH